MILSIVREINGHFVVSLTTLSGVRFGFTIASTDAIARHQASSRLDDYETSIE
jgi:hypothetical protein